MGPDKKSKQIKHSSKRKHRSKKQSKTASKYSNTSKNTTLKTFQVSGKEDNLNSIQDIYVSKKIKQTQDKFTSLNARHSFQDIDDNYKSPKLQHYKVVDKYIQLEKKFGIKSKSIGNIVNEFRGWQKAKISVENPRKK